MKPFRHLTLALIIAVSVLVPAASIAAGVVRTQPEDPKSILDRIYSVAQAERGEARFKVSCSSCHAPGDFAGGSFAERWSGQTMGDVFDFVSSAMPENDPGSLKPEEYASVLAFILRMNAYPVGSEDMPADPDALKNRKTNAAHESAKRCHEKPSALGLPSRHARRTPHARTVSQGSIPAANHGTK